jgi:UDP-N-acetylglucosamine:LPS N-acetylglucosamine transferase
MRRYANPAAIIQNVIDLLIKIPLGFLQSLFLLLFINPDAVFSKGGYGSFPVALAAWILRIPVFCRNPTWLPGWRLKNGSLCLGDIHFISGNRRILKTQNGSAG